MKLELPDNNASVLFHMGNALQSIARDIDTSLPVNGHKATHTETVEPMITMSDVTNMVKASLDDALERGLIGEPESTGLIDTCSNGNVTDAEQYGKSVLGDCLDNIDTLISATDTIDADGLPWDQRIHSRGKTRLADNTWRMARKPNDKSDEEWAEYVEGVKTELRALMAIPVVEAAVVTPPVVTVECQSIEEYLDGVNEQERIEDDKLRVTPPVVDAVVTPPVVDVVVTPPVVDAVVTPPVVDAVVTPPIVEAPEVVTPPVTTGPTTFAELMKFITVNNKKLTKESIDEALKAQGLASIALLAARTDLIPQVHAALVELL